LVSSFPPSSSKEKYKKLLVIVSSFTAGFVFFWLVAGQAINNLPAYFGSSREISNGYFAAMAVTESASQPGASPPAFASATGNCWSQISIQFSKLPELTFEPAPAD